MFAYSIAMNREISDELVHHRLQEDLVEHLWTLEGNI
jgi:hypothetical protein